jgi:signal transduction histidine kinase
LGLPIDYQYMGPEGRPRLPSHVETALYRITQEAITNIARHAKAARASVVVLHQLDNVTLLVEDNGKGFDTRIMAQDGLHSLGLTGIKERTGLLGGTCTVESAIGQGTVVRIQIPLKEIPS